MYMGSMYVSFDMIIINASISSICKKKKKDDSKTSPPNFMILAKSSLRDACISDLSDLVAHFKDESS